MLVEANAHILHAQYVKQIELILRMSEERRLLQVEIEQQRREAMEAKQREKEFSGEPNSDHILLFMIAPFSIDYSILEEAVRRVFESAPYFFEVRLARNYTYNDNLLENVRTHILAAHGYIAEISDLNPNVMFELGAVMLRNHERPILTLRSASSSKQVPSDFKEKLYIEYGALSDTLDTIVKSIKRALQQDGRPIHEGITKLMSMRRKRFLSKTLLSNLNFRMNEEAQEAILRVYQNLEDLLSVSAEQASRETKLPTYIVQAVQGAIREETNV